MESLSVGIDVNAQRGVWRNGPEFYFIAFPASKR